MKKVNKILQVITVSIIVFLAGCDYTIPRTTIDPDSEFPTNNPQENPNQQNSSNHTFTANLPFILKAGETGQFEQTKATIKFDSVESDSRCPQGVQCIWAGEAKLKLITSGFYMNNNSPVTTSISTMKNKIWLGGEEGVGYSLELQNLTESAKYEATFKLSVAGDDQE